MSLADVIVPIKYFYGQQNSIVVNGCSALCVFRILGGRKVLNLPNGKLRYDTIQIRLSWLPFLLPLYVLIQCAINKRYDNVNVINDILSQTNENSICAEGASRIPSLAQIYALLWFELISFKIYHIPIITDSQISAYIFSQIPTCVYPDYFSEH